MKTHEQIEIDGLPLPPSFDPEVFRSAVRFKPEKGDVVVASFPKCGTTWTIQIVILILRKGRVPESPQEYFSSNLFLEITAKEALSNRSKPGCLKTHLPFDRINFSPEAKYIYVTRHPADCVVSYYHHIKFFPIYCYSDATFDDFFESHFITGRTDFGDYFDHLLAWYKHRSEPNLLFITYESMKADPKSAILKIAKFLGDEYYESLMAEDCELLKKVLKLSSFNYMKETVNSYWKDVFSSNTPEINQKDPVMKNYARLLLEASEKGHFSEGNFVRKGVVGEGKIILSEDQRRRIESRMIEKCGDSDVIKLWDSS